MYMHNTNFLHNFFSQISYFLILRYLPIVHYWTFYIYVRQGTNFLIKSRSFYGRKLANISILPIPSAQLSDDECSFDDENDETDDTELNIYFHMMAVKLTRKKYFLIVKRLMAMKKSTLNRLILILLLINKSPGLILNNPTGLSLIIKYNFN